MRIAIGVFVAVQFCMSPVTSAQVQETAATKAIPTNEAIDFSGFVNLSRDLQQVRESRRIPIDVFNKMAEGPDTIILDTRSKWAFDVVHVAGAVHLNFSDFTAEKLGKVIPSKQTRILIYCNNNFNQSVAIGFDGLDRRQSPATAALASDRVVTDRVTDTTNVVAGTTNKLPTLALNIPTFINLYGYGYRNIYELADQLELDDPRLKLDGTGVR